MMTPDRRLDTPLPTPEAVMSSNLMAWRVLDLSHAELDAEDLRVRSRELDASWRPYIESEIARRRALVAHLMPAAEVAWQAYLKALDATRYGATWASASFKLHMSWCSVVQAVHDRPVVPAAP